MSLMNYRDLVFKRMIQILSVVLILGGCASQPKRNTQQPEAAQGAGTTQQQLALISNIEVEEKDDAVRVVIKGSAPLTYEVTQAESPLRLIIDVAEARLAISGEPIPVRKGVVSEIVPSELEKEGKKCARVEIAMNNTAHYEVFPTENDLWIDFPKPLPAVQKAEKVFDVIIDDTNKDYAQVDIKADGTIENFNSFNLRKPTRLVIDFSKLALLASVKEKVSASPLIKKVRWGEHADYLRMVFESPLNELPTFEVVPTSQGATVFFGTGFEGRKSQLMSMTPLVAQSSESLVPSPETKPEEAPVKAKTEEAKKDEVVASPAIPAPEAKVEAPPAAVTPPEPPVVEKQTQAEAASAGEKPEQASAKKQEVTAKVAEGEKTTQSAEAEATPVAKEKGPKYTGTHISLDFKDADIRNILRLIAEVSNLNIVAGDDVQGTVTIKLNDVPWDQALDVVLLSNNLGKSLDGNILRIAPIDKLEKQRKDTLAATESQAKLEPLKKALIPISYAQASQLKPVIQNSKVLSPRGSIEVDQRTNTLIVMDIQKNIEEARTIVDNLDTPIPQVLIEAKIIQINPTYTNELGVSWGGDLNTTASGGAIGAGGNVSGSGSTGVTTSQTILDLLPSDIGPGVGGSLAWGFFKKNFNIFNKIAAMEKDEKLEVISSPRVMTLDNQEALVEQGTEVPYLKIDTQAGAAAATNLATTEFKKVTLSLKVVPHVTPDGSVMMDIEAKKDQVSSQLGAGNQPGIDTRKAITKVLVRSGDTVVIGGIYEDTNRDVRNSVPFFGRIPILNFIFKGTSKKREKTEMIIFITPTIITIPKKSTEMVLTPAG
jgi:type IV pilus assembly protein PilQ